jgi:hypothetical protein
MSNYKQVMVQSCEYSKEYSLPEMGIYITTIISEDGSIRLSDKFIAGK